MQLKFYEPNVHTELFIKMRNWKEVQGSTCGSGVRDWFPKLLTHVLPGTQEKALAAFLHLCLATC